MGKGRGKEEATAWVIFFFNFSFDLKVGKEIMLIF